MTRWLGPSGYGLLSLAFLVPLLVASLGMFGIQEAIVYMIAGKRNDPHRILGTAIAFSVLLGLVYVALLNLLLPLLSSNILQGLTTDTIFLSVLAIPAMLLRSVVSQYLFASGNTSRYNLSEFSISLFSVICGFLFVVVFSRGVQGAITSMSLTYYLSLLWTLLMSRKLIVKGIHFITPDRQIASEMLSYGLRSFIGSLAQKLNYSLDAFIINYLAGPTAVGIYALAGRIAGIALIMPRILRMIRTAEVASEASASLASERVSAALFRKLLLSAPPGYIIYASFAAVLIPIIYGEAFRESVVPMLILMIGSAFLSFSMVFFSQLSGTGKPHLTSTASWIALTVTVISDIILIPGYGVVGAAVASTFAYMTYFVVLTYFFFRTFPISPQELFPKWDDLRIMSPHRRLP